MKRFIARHQDREGIEGFPAVIELGTRGRPGHRQAVVKMTDESIDNVYIKDVAIQEKFIFLFFSAESYLSALVAHGRSELTLKTYKSNVHILIPVIGRLYGNNARLEDITGEDFYRIKDMLEGSEATVRLRLMVLKDWIRFETGRNSFEGVRPLWNHLEPDRIFIDKSQFEIVYSQARSDSERLIMMLGVQMGLRLKEIISIRLSDIDGGELIIRGKGHNGGKIVRKQIPANLQRMIHDYILNEREEASRHGTDLLLLTAPGTHCAGRPVTRKIITSFYQRISASSGIKVTSHVMRRLYCTLLADEAGLRSDLDTLRRMMRHESIDTTLSCYLNANEVRIEEADRTIDGIFNSL